MHLQDEHSQHRKFKLRREELLLFTIPLLIILLFYGWNKICKETQQPPLYTLQSQAYIYDLAFSPDGKILAVSSSNDANDIIEFWDIQTRKVRHRSKSNEQVLGGAIDFSPNGKFLSVGYSGYSYFAKIWNTQTGKVQQTFKGYNGGVDTITFSSDGKRLMSASAYEERMIRIWDVHTNKLLHAQKLHGIEETRGDIQGEFIRGSAFSPDGKIFAGGVSRILSNATEMGQLRLWDTQTGKLLHSFPEQQGGIFGLAFSPDGQILASGSSNTQITVWDLKRMKVKFIFRGHRSSVVPVAFSDDGKFLVSGSGDELNDEVGEVIVWDLSTRKLLTRLTDDDEPVSSVAFSPNGKLIASSHDSIVKIWGMDGLTK